MITAVPITLLHGAQHCVEISEMSRIRDGVTSIGIQALFAIAQLESVDLLRIWIEYTIGASAFLRCPIHSRNINIPDSVRVLSDA